MHDFHRYSYAVAEEDVNNSVVKVLCTHLPPIMDGEPSSQLVVQSPRTAFAIILIREVVEQNGQCNADVEPVRFRDGQW